MAAARRGPAPTWDQRHSLRPPPYVGAMRRQLEGLAIGDAAVDELPDAAVAPCAAHRGAGSVMACAGTPPQSPEPGWVDWDLVRRGQALWLENLGRAFLALTAALVQGFTIARFAEVLHHAGYAQSPLNSNRRHQGITTSAKLHAVETMPRNTLRASRVLWVSWVWIFLLCKARRS
ncbi:unnamed protein product, partial [Prorocentrum cordatum]